MSPSEFRAAIPIIARHLRAELTQAIVAGHVDLANGDPAHLDCWFADEVTVAYRLAESSQKQGMVTRPLTRPNKLALLPKGAAKTPWRPVSELSA
jgi:hypothetical protein